MTNDLQVAIIGGGFAGLNTAYHLSKYGIESLIVEAGKIAEGNDEFPSGTVSPPKPDFTKWITHAFDSNYDEFSKMHGEKGSKTFLEMMNAGGEIIRGLIKNNKPELIRESGSIIVAEDGDQLNALEKEHRNYLELGFGKNYERLSKEQLNNSLNLNTQFSGGLFIPEGAMINQRGYVQMLRELTKPYVEICEKAKVIGLEEFAKGVKITTESSGEIIADNVVIATNGFYEDVNIKGLLEPKFTFMRCYEDKGEDTAGCWTFGEKYFYFTRQNNTLIIGGVDTPLNKNCEFKIDETEPMEKLLDWAETRFDSVRPKNLSCIHFGVYTKTKDELPLVGKFNNESRVSYILGCNAIGHTTYSLAATLMPSIMGYKNPSSEEEKFIEFLSPQRKTLK
jgi:glycine/D-amino acid oxidase-like deaminating enzyme